MNSGGPGPLIPAPTPRLERFSHEASSCALGGCRVPAVSCSEPRKPVPPGGLSIQGAGATFPAPLYKRWIREYEQLHHDVVLDYDAVGSGAGIRQFMEKSVDFGASDAAMTDDEMMRVPQGVQLVPVTAGIVVLAYNVPGVGEGLKLSREAYAGIFLGEIKSWDDPRIAAVNSGLALPKLPIAIVTRHDSSGTTFAFTNNLSAVSAKWRTGPGVGTSLQWPGTAMTAQGSVGVAGRVKRARGHRLRRIRFRRKRPACPWPGWRTRPASTSLRSPPTGLALTAAQLPSNLRVFVPDPAGPEAYPIVTCTWLLLYKKYEDPRRAAVVKDFVKWCLQDGQQHSEALGYIKLPPDIVTAALQAVDTVAP